MRYKHVPIKELWREYGYVALLCWVSIWSDIVFIKGMIEMPNEPLLYGIIALAGCNTGSALSLYACQKRHTKAQISKWIAECLPSMLAVVEAEQIKEQGF